MILFEIIADSLRGKKKNFQQKKKKRKKRGLNLSDPDHLDNNRYFRFLITNEIEFFFFFFPRRNLRLLCKHEHPLETRTHKLILQFEWIINSETIEKLTDNYNFAYIFRLK